MSGSIYRFLPDDHERLANLLRRSDAHPSETDLAAYAEFRAGLLKHIAMEEKILLPFAHEKLGTQGKRWIKNWAISD